MTTDARLTRATSATGVLFRTCAAAVLGCVVLGLAGLAFDGSAGALGALVGSAIVLLVFAGGTFFTNAVAGMMPSMSLLIAMMTYLLQLLVVLVVMLALDNSPAVGDQLSRLWIGVGVVGLVLVWTWAQLVLTLRARTPLFRVPEAGAEQ